MHIEVVDSIFEEEVDGYNSPALYYLARSIDMIGKVDAVFFAEGWQQAKGCVIERKVCEHYNILILDEAFLKCGGNVNNLYPQVKRI